MHRALPAEGFLGKRRCEALDANLGPWPEGDCRGICANAAAVAYVAAGVARLEGRGGLLLTRAYHSREPIR